MQTFKEYIIEEGQFLNAFKHGIKTGVKAFKEKMASKPTQTTILTQKILTAEGDDLKKLVAQIVNNGYTIKRGEVVKPSLVTKSTDWLLEHVQTSKWNQFKENRA